ncbi:MAG: type II secretion system F family protein [Deltaproteobacteria bacterium]|nr:type II secretion system F family protein [Deltaproteobacteria bacterium]
MLLGISALLFGVAVYYFVIWAWTKVLGTLSGGPEKRDKVRVGGGQIVRKLIKMTGGLVAGFLKQDYEQRIAAKLVMAGEPEGVGPLDFFATQFLSAVAFLIFALIFSLFFAFRPVNFVLVVVTLTFFGFTFPHVWLRDKVAQRHQEIARALPYALDLLTLSVEAGMDFAAAVSKVVEKGRASALVEELRLMLNHLRMGKTREEALKTLADRVNMPQLHQFTSALIQADRMGTSLGHILRIQSNQLRMDRTQRAEKLANEAPVKMLFPLIFCIFPTVFIVLFAPIIYQFVVGGV